MKFIKANIDSISEAAGVIKSGGLVAFPTETVYGLGADGLNAEAAAKIFEAKNRPSFNPLILHVNSREMLDKVAVVEDERIEELIKNFMPGPLTLVLPKKGIVPEIITSGHPTVAVRMPANEIALKLIELSERPIAAPSANSFGFLSPTKAEHVAKQLGDKIDMILDGGETNVGVESTIIELKNGEFYLLRPGGLEPEKIESITGKLKRKEDNISPNSPGQLKFHYSTYKPIKFLDEDNISRITDKDGVLFFRKVLNSKAKYTRVLSEDGNLRKAATNLFKYLHELEESPAEIIYVERVPETGLGKAIMDRLTKATNKYLGNE